jgi:Cd(II)/Pb(II)-responsive transcriptional regulator
VVVVVVMVVAMPTFGGMVMIASAAGVRRVDVSGGREGFLETHGAIENPEVAVESSPSGTKGNAMRIGDLATATGTAVETIRFYEREGLIPAARRADNNYRVYSAAHAERLAFIRHCRNLDMTLDEVRSLLRLRDAPSQDCGEVNALLDDHIGHVAQRIRELRALEKELKALRARCAAPHAIEDCGILSGLDSAAGGAAASMLHRHIRGTH